MMNIPFLDLKAQYQSIRDEIHNALNEVIDGTAFAGGPFVSRFEQAFARFCGCQEAIGVGSGTEALWMILLTLGVGPGDEVITVPNTFIATAEAISFCGATPVFVDIDEKTYNMDPNKLEELLKKRSAFGVRRSSSNPRSKQPNRPDRPNDQIDHDPPASRLPPLKAIIPVHLYGQPADMDPILELAGKYGLSVVEDACQAHGAQYKRKRAGTIGAAGAFSFYPGKNLGAYGEAGAVTTNDQALADRIRIFRDHGQPKRYYHDVVGWNGRMDGFQGAVLGVKLNRLEEWNQKRRENAERYRFYLSGLKGVILPQEADYARHVYHIFPIRVKNRDEVMSALGQKGINCGIHYPVPVHLQKAYEFLGHKKGDFPVSEKIASEVLSLPMFPELAEEQIAYIADALKDINL
ncbi:MAG: DegT/DnrJ/EryC1/StrS family aminotransferase [Thermodesulfobacteriota bacterium]